MNALLPDHLLPRVRALNPHPPRVDAPSPVVVAWPRVSLRAAENPLLDVAIAAADALGLPVAVVHGLSERYPYASARHHTFALQGHRDLAHGLAERGIAAAFHLERPGHRGPHLHTLAQRVALIVTDDMPLDPLRAWAGRVADRAACPVWAVDTACVVPMNLMERKFTRAFRFRQAHEPHRRAFLHPAPDARPERSELPDLPFEPIDLACEDVGELVGRCAVDPTVGPVPHAQGGSRAGYARWRDFVRSGSLKHYARDRNDPNRHGVSRLSAYLHYGMVAPTRLAREALAHGGSGADKWVDELLTWRELAYTFCRHTPTPEGLSALPAWARDTLHAHRTDPRDAAYDLDDLRRGTTGEPLWDAAQRSLLRHGELHNNLRMTWGKAILRWTPDPETALATLLDLNHRYALDGRDPASLGGILWCLGGLDRPFPPERPILGTVRPRPLDAHAARLDLDTYRRHVDRPLVPAPPRIAIVGLGPAGALLARTLHDHGLPVVALDKGRGPGGRLSSRRTDVGRFDHGAPALDPLPAPLAHHERAWIDAGLLTRWAGPFVHLDRGEIRPAPTRDQRIATPSMNSLIKHLLRDVPTRFGERVTALSRHGDGIQLLDGDRVLSEADHVVLALPGPQAAPLLQPLAPDLAARAAQVRYAPAWVTLVAWPIPLPGAWAHAVLSDPVLRAIVRQEALPGRAPGARWVLHATPELSQARLEEPPEVVAQIMIDALRRHLDVPEPIYGVAHRWRYSQPRTTIDAPFLTDGAFTWCGDGLAGDGIAGALSSGGAVAAHLIGRLRDEPERPAQLDLL